MAEAGPGPAERGGRWGVERAGGQRLSLFWRSGWGASRQVAQGSEHCSACSEPGPGARPPTHPRPCRAVPPLQWPSLLRPLSPILNEMPGMVLERYAGCQTVAFCGARAVLRAGCAAAAMSGARLVCLGLSGQGPRRQGAAAATCGRLFCAGLLHAVPESVRAVPPPQACSPRSGVPGPPWTTPSSSGALTSGGLGCAEAVSAEGSAKGCGAGRAQAGWGADGAGRGGQHAGASSSSMGSNGLCSGGQRANVGQGHARSLRETALYGLAHACPASRK